MQLEEETWFYKFKVKLEGANVVGRGGNVLCMIWSV